MVNSAMSPLLWTPPLDGKSIQAHKIILAAHSPIFKAMFCVDIKEEKEGTGVVDDIEADAFEERLRFMYTGTVSEEHRGTIGGRGLLEPRSGGSAAEPPVIIIQSSLFLSAVRAHPSESHLRAGSVPQSGHRH